MLHVEVDDLLDEMVRCPIGLVFQPEHAVEGGAVEVIVPLVARLEPRAEVRSHAQHDDAAVEDEVVRDLGSMVTARTDARLER